MLLIPATTERNPVLAWAVAMTVPHVANGICCQFQSNRRQQLLYFSILLFFCCAFLSFLFGQLCALLFCGPNELRIATASANANGNEQQQWHLQLPPAVPAVSDDCGSSVCHTNQFMADQRLNNFCLALCNWRADNYAWQACSTALEPPKKKNNKKHYITWIKQQEV